MIYDIIKLMIGDKKRENLKKFSPFPANAVMIRIHLFELVMLFHR